MSKPEPKKRPLKFDNFDAMMSEVDSLMKNGYNSNGNWTLGQTCGHVALWMQYPIDGFPKPPIFIRMIFSVMRYTVGPGMKKRILRDGFKGGSPTAPESVPDSKIVSDEIGIEQLRQAVNRVENHTGELLASPLFGPMDQATLVKVSLLHAEHHLGYLEPCSR
ncbi:MAG: DUF1569 domain-containing protein [Mariniblastus sp.]